MSGATPALALDAALVERDRYREALREIADYVFANDDPEGLDATVFQQIAREALNGDTE